MVKVVEKKILMIGLFPPPFSSGETVITQYFYDLLMTQYDVTVINMSIGVLAPQNFKLASLFYYAKTIVNFFRVFSKVYFISRRRKFDLCYLTPASSIPGHLRDIIIIKLLSKHTEKVTINIQNGNYDVIFKRDWHASLTEAFIKRISLAIFTSEILKKKAQQFIGINKCAIIRNTVDDKIKCTDDEVKRSLIYKFTRLEFVICYISNMNPTKGYLDLLEALIAMDVEYRKNLKVNFVGEWLSDEQLEEFNVLIKVNNLQGNIVIYGKVNDREKLKSFYLDANVFVLPTYFPREAQPVSIIEALNAGVPVISTNHASIPDLIVDGYNGILVDIKSLVQIKDSVIKLLTEKKYWNNMSINARTSFERNFTSEKIRRDIITLFNNEIYNNNKL